MVLLTRSDSSIFTVYDTLGYIVLQMPLAKGWASYDVKYLPKESYLMELKSSGILLKQQFTKE